MEVINHKLQVLVDNSKILMFTNYRVINPIQSSRPSNLLCDLDCLPLQFYYLRNIQTLLQISSIYISRPILFVEPNYISIMENKGTVLVTGATGYIASHVIHQLLQRGYQVVGTVRNLANKQKYSFLYDLPHAKQHLQLRQADLLKPDTWDAALKAVQNVFHIASPAPPCVPKDENELIKPAVEGTQNVIDACLRNKIKRIVFTSSCITVIVRSDGKISNEDDWSEEPLLQHYSKSKYLAQRRFWQEAQKHGNELEFVSLLPAMVTGPAFSRHGNSSQAFLADILNGGYPGIPSPATEYCNVDIRDTAVAHIKALEIKQAKGKRYLISGYNITTYELFDILRAKYGHLGYKIPTNYIDAQGIKKSGHGPTMRTMHLLGKKLQLDNSRSIKQLGMIYKGAEESLIDQAERQIQLGIIKKLE